MDDAARGRGAVLCTALRTRVASGAARSATYPAAGGALTPYAVAAATPAASRKASALSVRSQVKSGSSRPKWPYAAVFW